MTTPNTGIPYVPEGTLDPAAGLNLALNHIDALLQVAVLEFRDSPPGSPADGDLYIIGTGSGAWSGHDDELARYVGDGDFWQFYDPEIVRLVYSLDDQGIYVWSGTAWVRWPVLGSLTDAADDTAASGAGVAVGQMYRNGSVLMIRVA